MHPNVGIQLWGVFLSLNLFNFRFGTDSDISIKINDFAKECESSAFTYYYRNMVTILAERNIMIIRNLINGEEMQLFKVFSCAIHDIASKDYTQEQINAWVPKNTDMALWTSRIRALKPYVAVINEEIVGYSDLQPNGYIDHFFVSGEYARQGVGTSLMKHIHEEAKLRGISTLTADVSKTAEAFFLHNGFYVVERKFPVRHGVVLENASMKKILIS